MSFSHSERSDGYADGSRRDGRRADPLAATLNLKLSIVTWTLAPLVRD